MTGTVCKSVFCSDEPRVTELESRVKLEGEGHALVIDWSDKHESLIIEAGQESPAGRLRVRSGNRVVAALQEI